MTEPSLRIATWNILGRRVDGGRVTAKKGAVKAIIADQSIDVLCLQEVHFYRGNPDRQLLAELRDAGLKHFVGEPLSASHLDKSARLGVGVASAWPLTRDKPFYLTNPLLTATVRGQRWVLHNKGMIGCLVETPDGRQIRVYSLHLFPFHEFGIADDHDLVTNMWREFWEYADSLVDTGELILAGDFNQTERESAARLHSSRPWQFHFGDRITTTFGLSLDEIALSWAPPPAEVKSVPTFSDHHLAVLDVQLGNGLPVRKARPRSPGRRSTAVRG